MSDAWDLAMRGLSDLELRLIMQGAKNGTLRAVGDPANAYGAGLKAAMELNRRAALQSPNTSGKGADAKHDSPVAESDAPRKGLS